jgi:hypothetical protein
MSSSSQHGTHVIVIVLQWEVQVETMVQRLSCRYRPPRAVSPRQSQTPKRNSKGLTILT